MVAVAFSSALSLAVPQFVRRFFDTFIASLEGAGFNLNRTVLLLLLVF